ncbi:purine-cytosine permease family protein [Candidatus Latescibacterota bacterium]
MSTSKKTHITERLDALYEFDREPVTEGKLQGIGNFIGMYSGEHVAGTEFVIGPLFVAHGVSAPDLFLGLLAGNILAVCSWAFLCAPISVRTRLTLYWQLRRICGPYLTVIYSIVNALMFCFLAGAMIAVAATAIGLPFKMPMPGLNDMLPNSVSWVVIVFLVGAVVTSLAILGFEKLSEFAKICSPWMFLVFVAAGLAVLPRLGCTSISDFWRVANEKIWTGIPLEGQSKFTFWHIMFFAWFCNMAMHIGMADMSILRYARKWYYGFASAFGMFLGHYVAWVCSGILCAAANGEITPGPIAYMGAGVAGAVCVVIAGWTTANPTLYRAGLAFQVATPDWKRWKVTLVAGLVTTTAACFPALVMKLLDFVALYGLILMPMGAVIFADFWILPKVGLKRNFAEITGVLFSWHAGITWIVTLAICFLIPVEIFFKGLPGWFIAIFLYVVLSALIQKRKQFKAYSTEV